MNEGIITSTDYKIGKDGRKYPAKRFHMGKKEEEEQIEEASYRGNIGVMELAKFHSSASKEDKEKFAELMKKKRTAPNEKEEKQMAMQIWGHVQKVTGTKLMQIESTQRKDMTQLLSFKALIESSDDFVLQTLANRDINASVKNGKVVVHDHTQHAKAKKIVQRLASGHEVVKEDAEELEELSKDMLTKMATEETDHTAETVHEAMSTHEFNKLVHGYLRHKKAARIGGFKHMSIDQYKRVSDKALTTAHIKEENIDEVTNSKTMSVPMMKPRDPNHKVMATKKNAAGAHKDMKKEMKNGNMKHSKDTSVE